ncbi:MAG: chemoreceptor glutamine deamidase CheD [Gammaproteobacteria bacterium]|nr:chemoreceptor glutamine deamidase CheD [Gammaproteobacteria bacterium]
MSVQLHRRHALPPSLPGFGAINRYWDTVHDMPAAKILPGEYYVTTGKELVTTVLGSCVSACIRDRVFGIGGMNHFMLPISMDGKGWGGVADMTSTATRYGNFAMEHMINDILKHGGHKRHLEAKVFGGGKMMDALSDVGAKNIEFVREYLELEGIPLLGGDVGDIFPRKVIYIPSTGKALMKRIKHLHNDTILRRENDYRSEITQHPLTGDVELF